VESWELNLGDGLVEVLKFTRHEDGHGVVQHRGGADPEGVGRNLRKDTREPLALSDRGERNSVEKRGESGICVPRSVLGVDGNGNRTLTILVAAGVGRK
jgi:hypothetical protein